MVEIYTLSDPRTNEIKYLGKTERGYQNRFKEHLRDSRRNKRESKLTNLNKWLKELTKENLNANLHLIDNVSQEDWIFWEQYWIEQLKAWGHELCNHTNGGEGSNCGAEKNGLSITMYTLDNRPVKNFKSCMEANKWLNTFYNYKTHRVPHISVAAAKNKASYGFIWKKDGKNKECSENNINIYKEDVEELNQLKNLVNNIFSNLPVSLEIMKLESSKNKRNVTISDIPKSNIIYVNEFITIGEIICINH